MKWKRHSIENVVQFTLSWVDPATRRRYVITHLWDGVGEMQAGYTLKGWKLKCISFNKALGLIYEGQVGRDTRPYKKTGGT